jgi:hypothetical protein
MGDAMMLRKGWFKRLAAAGANDAVPPEAVVLDFFAVDLECVCEHGTYYVGRLGSAWSARFRGKAARVDERSVAIDARDAAGEPLDWPTRGCAEEACRLHSHLLDLGHGVLRATELVAERSRRVEEHQRVPTLEYAAVRT